MPSLQGEEGGGMLNFSLVLISTEIDNLYNWLTDTLKCDLTLPGCLRCAKIKKDCPGYRKYQDLLFRNQDIDSFALKAARPRKKRAEVIVRSKENSVVSTGEKFSFSDALYEIQRIHVAGTVENSAFQSAKISINGK